MDYLPFGFLKFECIRFSQQLLEDSIEERFEKHGVLPPDSEKVDGENKEADGEDNKVRKNHKKKFYDAFLFLMCM